MAGFYDSINDLEAGIKDGSIKVEVTNDGLRLSGRTFDLKDFLKREYGARWNRDRRSWDVTVPEYAYGADGKPSSGMGKYAGLAEMAGIEADWATGR
ncbi:hypothetical protein [Olsenella phocaeensis]|uniref:hypothetical protein n=1 Tax=Olsenella phocaeensis TaxID=1852385 RepID=UPI00093068D1|nr:hypothetical protein [Olsenella phocaeensis]